MKVIGVGLYLILSCLFLTVLGSLVTMTAKEFEAFNGVDPTTHCGNMKCMQDECNKLGKANGYTDGNQAFLQGFPNCIQRGSIVLLNDTNHNIYAIRYTRVMNCMWKSNDGLCVGKGQHPGHFMQYHTRAGQGTPYKDLPYPCH